MIKIALIVFAVFALPQLSLAVVKRPPRRPAPRSSARYKKLPSKPVRLPAQIQAPPPPVDTSIDPDVFESWLAATDAIKENPPYLFILAPTKEFQPAPCPAGSDGGAPGTLKRTCFNTASLAAPDSRLKQSATLDNRLSLVRHYLGYFHLPMANQTQQITMDWTFRKSSPQGGGVDDFNALVGMIRYELYLSQTTLEQKLKEKEKLASNDPKMKPYLTSLKLVTLAEISGYQRQRRLVDFWFPDGPAWSAGLVGTCSEHAREMPANKCCFLTLGGCLRK